MAVIEDIKPGFYRVGAYDRRRGVCREWRETSGLRENRAPFAARR